MNKFTVGNEYNDRDGWVWMCVKSKWGSLPEFETAIPVQGAAPIVVRCVRAQDGRYRFDQIDHPLDMVLT